MPSWWPFSSSGGRDSPANTVNATEVHDLPSIKQSVSYQEKLSGAAPSTYTKDVKLSATQTELALRNRKIMNKKDARAEEMDPESIDTLLARFPAEFAKADEVMKEKKQNESYFRSHDYASDRSYQLWSQKEAMTRQVFKYHWLDTLIDWPIEALVYVARLTTTAGLSYGVGRTLFLYRSMDRNYAKLNGVTLGAIALNEIPVAVVQGAVAAVAVVVGVQIGDSVANVITSVTHNMVQFPERNWGNIAAAVTCGVGLGGTSLALMQYKTFTRWGIGAISVGSTALGAVLGLCLGYVVYRPIAASREHPLSELQSRPWYERSVSETPYGGLRGRYQ